MQIQFTPTEQDWRSTLQDSPMSGWGMLQWFLTFVPLFLLGGSWASHGYEIAGGICLISSIGIALAGYEVPRLHHRKVFRTSKTVQWERTVTVDERGITTTLPVGQLQYEWRAFSRFSETKTSFLLCTSPQLVSVWIPKRAMSPAQIDELRGILRMRTTAPLAARDECDGTH
jgi:hypothetical protein